MKRVSALLLLLMVSPVLGQDRSPATLKSVLLAQLRSTHNKNEWFVGANTAVQGITAEQASWTDAKGNHSIGQLTNHLVFWDGQSLAKFKGEATAKFEGNNDETFKSFDAKTWNATVQKLDAILTELEKVVEGMDDAKIQANAVMIAHIGTHNAYHIGQIVAMRKLQGSWDAEKGVK